MFQSTYIDLILHLNQQAEHYSDVNGGWPLQIRDGNNWKSIADAARLNKTKRWWECTFRAKWRFFEMAMNQKLAKLLLEVRIVPVPDHPTSSLIPLPSEIDAMLKQLGVVGVVLAKDMSILKTDAIAVFSDEDATLLSAHFSTE